MDHDAVTQAVANQRLLSVGEADLPWRARVLQGVQGRCTRSAVVTGDQHHIGLALGNSRRNGSHAHLGHQLGVDARLRVGVLEVVDELLEVLNGVDVVVRGRGNEPHTRRGVARGRDPRVHLGSGKLSTFAGLCTLGELDLQVFSVDEVLRGDPKAPGGHLLDGGTTLWVMQTLRRLASFTGVGLAAQTVHGNGESLVRFLRDGAVRHCARLEALHDLRDVLHLFDGNRLTVRLEVKEATQGHQLGALVVNESGVLLEDLVLARTRGVLQLEHRLRVEQVQFPVTAPLVLATRVQALVGRALTARGISVTMPAGNFLGEDIDTDAVDLAWGPSKVLVHHGARQTDRLEHLRAPVGGNGGNAHLGHDFQDTLTERLDEVLHRLLGADVAQVARLCELFHGLHRKVRVDRCGPVADE